MNMKNNNNTGNSMTNLFDISWNETNRLKEFYSNIQIENKDEFSKIMLILLADNNVLPTKIILEFISLRVYYIIYNFLYFENNKFNLNDLLLDNNSSNSNWLINIKKYLEINFFINSSSFTIFNTEIDEILVWEIIKLINDDKYSFDFSIWKQNENIMTVFNSDFKEILINCIWTLRYSDSSEKLRLLLMNNIKSLTNSLAEFIKKYHIDKIKWDTQTKAKINLS